MRRHEGHGQGHGHGHRDANPRWLGAALGLIVALMAGELVVGIVANSLALLSDAAHLVTDAAALVLALVALRLARRPPRGGFTYGLKRAEILSAQVNGITLLLLAAWLCYSAARRLIDPPEVEGMALLVTALAGVAVNVAAVWCVSKANRTSLNIRGAHAHLVTDLAAFLGTAVAGLLILTTGFARADPLASLVVVALMVRAGVSLVRDSGRVLLEGAPAGLDPARIGTEMAALSGVAEVHDLHVWEISSGSPALSAHVLVAPSGDCHHVRAELQRMLRDRYELDHATLQVDHAEPTFYRIGQSPEPH